MDQSGATQAMNRYGRFAPLAAVVDDALYLLAALVLLPPLAHFLSKPSALRPSPDAQASVQLSGETA